MTKWLTVEQRAEHLQMGKSTAYVFSTVEAGESKARWTICEGACNAVCAQAI
jgi:hypothetical protein